MDDIEVWTNRPLLAYSMSAGGWYQSITYNRKPVIIHKSTHMGPPNDERSREKLSKTLAGRVFYRPWFRGLIYRHKEPSVASWDYGVVYQASVRLSASVARNGTTQTIFQTIQVKSNQWKMVWKKVFSFIPYRFFFYSWCCLSTLVQVMI